MGPRGRVVGEVVGVYLAVCLAVFALDRVRGGLLGELAQLGVSLVFLMSAMRLAQREPGGPRRYGIDLGGLLAPPPDPDPMAPTAQSEPPPRWELLTTLRAGLPSALAEARFAALVVAVVFPPFTLGYWLWNAPTGPFELRFGEESPWLFALTHLLVVALPEEAFFRGYVQTRLGDAMGRSVRLLGAAVRLGPWLLQAVLFALIHLLDPVPARLAVFFPALLFGWMRARRGGIGAAVLVHAFSNFYAQLLAASWR